MSQLADEKCQNHIPIRLGMPMWSHSSWDNHLYQGDRRPERRLLHYAQVFSTVEGNTTFYAQPQLDVVRRWATDVPGDFRFTFKLPQTITHQAMLQHVQVLLSDFLQAMQPVHELTSLWMIQLPHKFGPSALPILERFLSQLPHGFSFGVEVRHREFFAKGNAEQQLNRLLMRYHVDRIILDSRPVFANKAYDGALLDAQHKKPQLPVHAIACASQPCVRFIGGSCKQENHRFFKPWLKQLTQWIEEGLKPHLFVHTPDNQNAPVLAYELYQQLQAYCYAERQFVLPELSWPTQNIGQQLGIGI